MAVIAKKYALFDLIIDVNLFSIGEGTDIELKSFLLRIGMMEG